jgi:hypothetical protein
MGRTKGAAVEGDEGDEKAGEEADGAYSEGGMTGPSFAAMVDPVVASSAGGVHPK